MSHIRPPNALTALRRTAVSAAVPPSVDEIIQSSRPEESIHCLRPAVLRATAARFVAEFRGDVLYAVKCNPDADVLEALWDGGVRHFDCASAGEVALVRGLFPDAVIHFMHPVKARSAIREAYRLHDVRDFVLDSAEELAKIMTETGNAQDLGLVVRLGLPRGNALYDLSGKFGAPLEEAVALLRAARPLVVRLGVSFHVGSQCMDPLAYRRALALAGEAIRQAGVAIDVVDVGGGFPVSYPDLEPPPLGAYFAEIEGAFDDLNLPQARLWAEPGRALVAAGSSVVVQVQHRRGDTLYINDGVYGSLSDAGAPAFRFPARLIRDGGARSAATLEAFAFFGPTCDSADYMKGPFFLPADIREGDWIEIGQLGAYGACLATEFNGFGCAETVAVRDQPMLQTPGHPGDDQLDLAA
ncbi:type III PLP-dependent enzyme [Acidisoma cellulosilytica]|uniref:ornithine decarboxylase n=1 Tax=Acidisoma cellulosilyticum TaxID=2802395 RepID=A0A963Z480_9PROT|nr:type III PLP-dependent enzyme [Acidisoma cellulosilyticum]MCB8882514.1 type III PLP-dependent enzyme [Acidisoma cellulosilyticum]